MRLQDVLSLAENVGEILSKVIDQLPDYEQRKLEKFYDYMNQYQQERSREDADFDDLLAWREQLDLMFTIIIKEVSRPRQK